MTEKALKKLEDQLKCPICLDTYTDPKQLQCHHTFCRKCLIKMFFRDKEGQPIVTCPHCRHDTPVPTSGVASLKAAHRVCQLLKFVMEHKETTPSTDKVKQPYFSIFDNKNNIDCFEHSGRMVELYCRTCEEVICYKCIEIHEKHFRHNYGELDEAFETFKTELMSSLEPLEKQLVMTERALVHLGERCEEIFRNEATVEANIRKNIRRLQEALNDRQTELIGQLHQLTQAKLKSLTVQRQQIEATQAQLSSYLHFMKEHLKKTSQSEVLLKKKTSIQHVNGLTATFESDILEANTKADVIFTVLVDIGAAVQNYGRVHKKDSPDPTKCVVSGMDILATDVTRKSIAHLRTVGFDDQLSKEDIGSIMCELVSEMTGTRVGGSVERRGESQYELSYQPTIKGRHQLHIKVEGQHIRGSPFPVTARSPVEKLGTPILTIGEVDGPEGVAINKKGEVVVAERYGCCVTVFSPRGEKIRSFGTRGSGQGQFNDPYGVAVDREDCILVTDRYNNRIQKFSPEGDFLAVVGRGGSGPLQFHNPQGITFNTRNDKVYVSDWNCQIQVLNSDLSYVTSFGKKGKGEGEFGNPRHLACDSHGNVYVADYGSHFVQVFTAEGKFMRMLGKNGDKLGGPIGLAIDSSDRVYVSEWTNHCVSVFDSRGQFLLSFGSEGTEPGQFDHPSGLAVDFSGVVYACNFGSCNHVQMF